MRGLAKAPSAGPNLGSGTTRARKSLFGMACACVLALVAFAGSGAPSAEAADEPCPNAQFRTGPGANLPECRAYEQVSPVDKNGGDIEVPFGGLSVSTLGDRAIYAADTEFAGTESGGDLLKTVYISQRAGGDWVTKPLSRRVEPASAPQTYLLSSPSLSHSLLSTTGLMQLDPPHPPAGDLHVYSRDNTSGVIKFWLGLSSLQNPLRTPFPTPSWDRLVFGNTEQLTSDPGMPSDDFLKLYEKIGDQPVRLVSVLPDGTPASHEVALGGPDSLVGAVSLDGAHIFFSEMSNMFSPPKNIYRRDNGTSTILVSPSKRTLPVDPVSFSDGKNFWLATPDSKRVLFTSDQLLTDDANTGPVESGVRFGNDLYRYDVQADELIDISATPGGKGAQVQGVLGADSEAGRIYYAAKGQVVAGEGTPGQANLYLWEDDGTADGTTRFIAALLPRVEKPSEPADPGDSQNWSISQESRSRVSSDGRYLLFESRAVIPGGGDGSVTQVYRYDAEANGGAGQLDCVSCNSESNPPVGPARVTRGKWYWEAPRNLLDDGRVFFTSQDTLLSQDTNGEEDVYLWNEGELHLLSLGTGSRASSFYGASADGEDVFMLTGDALVPQDGDDLIDLYDVRVEGGLVAQFETRPPGCTGEECRTAGTQPPNAPGALTPSFQGPGDRVTKPTKGRCPKGKRRVRARNGNVRCVKKKAATRNNDNRANSNRRASR